MRLPDPPENFYPLEKPPRETPEKNPFRGFSPQKEKTPGEILKKPTRETGGLLWTILGLDLDLNPNPDPEPKCDRNPDPVLNLTLIPTDHYLNFKGDPSVFYLHGNPYYHTHCSIVCKILNYKWRPLYF